MFNSTYSVNTHTHLPMTLLSGVGEGLPLKNWLFDEIIPREKQLTPEDIYLGACIGIKELKSCGVTHFSDMYFGCEEIIRAVRDEGNIKANIALGITSEEDIDKTEALFERFGHSSPDDDVVIDVALHAEYTSTPAIAKKAAALAKKHGAVAQIHLSETREEHEECIARHGCTPAEYMSDCGIFENPTIAAHCVWVTDSDIALLAKSGVSVAHCPTSNLRLGCGIAPIAKMLEAGINVTLGTDGSASCDILSVWHEAHLASLLQRGINRDASLLPEETLVKMATVNGLRAQRRSISPLSSLLSPLPLCLSSPLSSKP